MVLGTTRSSKKWQSVLSLGPEAGKDLTAPEHFDHCMHVVLLFAAFVHRPFSLVD
jgi:hypothetical protein